MTKPLDLSNLIRHAFMTGAGVGNNERIPDDVQARWLEYDPCDLPCYQRISEALPLKGGLKPPETVGEAELMQKLGFAWLQQNAPERIAEAVRDTTQLPPIGWWYEDSKGCFHMSLDLDLGLQHERQFGYKLNWITSAEPGRWFENFDDIKRLRKLRELCGHVANGSQRTIMIGQDDATKDWIIHAGKEWWYGPSLGQAIDAAVVDED